MNQSRVNLKHHGSIPSDADLEQFRADVTTFLTDATQMVFHADFSSVDMADLVTQPEAVTLLRQAKAQAGQGDHAEALALLSEAFEYLLDDYASRKRTASGTSVFTWWPPSTSPRHFPPTSTDYEMALARPIHSSSSPLKTSSRPCGSWPWASTTAAMRASRWSCPPSTRT